jgi:hypothetical protein
MTTPSSTGEPSSASEQSRLWLVAWLVRKPAAAEVAGG